MSHSNRNEHADIRCIDSLLLSNAAIIALVKSFVEKGHRIQFRARGDSMFPFIKNGDMVTVTPYKGAPPETGDIVAFSESGGNHLILHRIIGLTENTFTTKGDNCRHRDPTQPIHKILGYISEINNRPPVSYGMGYTQFKKGITFFSRLGITAVAGAFGKKISFFLRR